MIKIEELTDADKGRRVIYESEGETTEQGVLEEWDHSAIWVRYAIPKGDMSWPAVLDDQAVATAASDLTLAPNGVDVETGEIAEEPARDLLQEIAEQQNQAAADEIVGEVNGQPITAADVREACEQAANEAATYKQDSFLGRAPLWWEEPPGKVVFQERQRVGGGQEIVVQTDLRGRNEVEAITICAPEVMTPKQADILKGMLDRAVKAAKVE